MKTPSQKLFCIKALNWLIAQTSPVFPLSSTHLWRRGPGRGGCPAILEPRVVTAFLAIVLGLGCAAHGLPSAAPGPPEPVKLPLVTISTLQPTFTWDSVAAKDVSYDLIICAGISNDLGFWLPGKTVYFRAQLHGTSHTISKPLSPATVYVWSVRAHSGKITSKWASYTDDHPRVFGKSRQHYELMSPFKTPRN